MDSVKKLVKKEEVKAKKNPGKKNKEKRNAANKAKRGDPIPVSKVVTPKKTKEKDRNILKKQLKKEIEDIY